MMASGIARSHATELPDWLDQAVEAGHADLSLAILIAFVQTLLRARESPSPHVHPHPMGDEPYMIVACDNFA